MTRIIPLLLAFLAMTAATSCSCNRSGDNESGRDAPLTEERARQLGVAAARTIAASDHSDTLDLQRCIVDAHATRSQMELDGNHDAAVAFDQALRDELKQSDPALADEMFSSMP